MEASEDASTPDPLADPAVIRAVSFWSGRYARRLGMETEDLAQEIWLRLARCAPGYDPARGLPSTWAVQICRTVVHYHRRRRQAQKRGGPGWREWHDGVRGRTRTVSIHDLPDYALPRRRDPVGADVERRDEQRAFWRAVAAVCNEREVGALTARVRGWTLEKVGLVLGGVGRERARQIIRDAVRKVAAELNGRLT